MNLLVTQSAQRDEVLFGITAELTPRLHVMNLEIIHEFLVE
jgi:hypothetical protein